MTNISTEILDIAGLFTLAVGAVAYIRSTSRKINDSASVELIANLTKLRETDREEFAKRLKALEVGKLENQKAISRLEGQVAAYKDLPLNAIAASMEKMAAVNSSIAQSNTLILETLKNSAIIAATDREVLTNPVKNQTITEQTVEHQTVRSSK